MVRAATALNSEARENPGGPAALRVGYLLGAAERGAEDTAGIHAELIRRLEAAAKYSPGSRPLPRAFERAYEEGFEAGPDHRLRRGCPGPGAAGLEYAAERKKIDGGDDFD